MSEERMAFRAEVSRLLDIVVHSLYSDKEIFLRELVSNASDACDKLRYEALTRPELLEEGESGFRIAIALDPKARTLTVTDNGVGMSRDELIENLGTIARSGTAGFLQNLEEAKKTGVTQIGQFGVGFYAAFMVAQMVEVTSRRAGTEESWTWRSDGKDEFAVEESEPAPRGTQVTLYLRQGEDEFLDEHRLRQIILRYSNHIALPIFLGDGDAPVNRASALWLRPRAEITPEQYREFYHHVAHAFDTPALTIHWRAEGKIEYTGLVFVPGMKPMDIFDPKRRHGVKLYVKRVFITDEAEGLVPPWLRFLRGVVDSEDLPLNVSREMLQHNPMLEKIRQGLTRRVLGDLEKFSADAEAYAAFWGHFGAILKEGLYEDAQHRPELLKLLRFRTTRSEGLVSLAEYVSRMPEGQESILYITGEDPEALARSPHLEGFRARGIEVLLLTDTVDDFWPAAVGAYEGKAFRSATRAEPGASAPKPSSDGQDKGRTPANDEEGASDLAPLLSLMQATLKDRVKDVRTTDRLTDSAVCLVADEGDVDIHLERFLKMHNQIRTPSLRIMEINPNHPLIRSMAAQAKACGEGSAAAGTSPSGSFARLQDVALLLLDQARLLDGENVSDPIGFGRRLDDLLARAL